MVLSDSESDEDVTGDVPMDQTRLVRNSSARISVVRPSTYFALAKNV